MRFEARYHVVGHMGLFSEEVIREEPSFERRPLEWVRGHGGPVARAFVAALPADYQDDRTLATCFLNHLRPGWRTRAMGNFHTHGIAPHDSTQDKYDRALCPGIVAVAGTAALTRICEGTFELPEKDRTGWDAALRDLIARGSVRERVVEEGALVMYGWGDFHAGAPAQRDGFRVILFAWNGEGEAVGARPRHCVENQYSPNWPTSAETARAFEAYRLTRPPWDPVRAPVHESRYSVLARVDAKGGDELRESSLFAADRAFALEHGGPLTQQFVAALPDEWQRGPLLIDSFLNWVRPGWVPGWDRFHFEPFPGQYEGARAHANWDEDQQHISCCFSTDALPEFLVGRIEPEGDWAHVEEFWRACTNLHRRHEELMRGVARGTLRIERVPAFTLYQHGWGDFSRSTPATRSGFHFRIRATRNPRRPACNLLRNVGSTDLDKF